MFPKDLRLPIKETRSRRPDNTITTPLFSTKAFNNGLKHNRFAVVIGNKVDPKSTGRHVLKRRVLEIMRTWPNLSRDFLVVLLPRARGSSYNTLLKTGERVVAELRKK